MAATLVQTTGLLGVSSSTAASETYNASTAFTVGNRVIVAITVNGNGLISSVSIAGTTADQDAARTTDAFRNCWIFSAKIENSGRTNVSITYDNTNSRSVALSIEEWSGIEYKALDQANNALQTTATTHSIQTTNSTTFPNELVYAVMMTLGNPGTVTFPSGYTATFDNYDANPYNVYGGAAYKTETTADIKSASWTSTSAATNRLAIATYRVQNDVVVDNGFVQHAWADDGAQSPGFDDVVSVTMPSNVTNENVLLWVINQYGNPSNPYTFSGGGLTYTELGKSADGAWFWGYAKVTSTQALTVTVTFGSGDGSLGVSPGLYIMERSDIDFNNPATGNTAKVIQLSLGTAAGASISPDIISPTQADQFILSICLDGFASGNIAIPQTGYTDHGTIWDQAVSGPNAFARVISTSYRSFKPRQATFVSTGGAFGSASSAVYNLEVPAGVKAKQYANGAFQAIRFIESTI